METIITTNKASEPQEMQKERRAKENEFGKSARCRDRTSLQGKEMQ